MIKSMTGFGHAEKVTSQCKITVELKSVNHRYLDLNIKMPRRFNMLEGQVRNLLKQYMQRGKVDVFITYEDYTSSDYTLKYNKDLAAEYLRYLNQMAEEFHLENDIRVTALSRYPEVLSMEEQSVDEEELWKLLSDPLKEACTKFVETRIREGNHLKEDLLAKLEDPRRWFWHIGRNWNRRYMNFWKIPRLMIIVLQQKLFCFQTRSAMMKKP